MGLYIQVFPSIKIQIEGPWLLGSLPDALTWMLLPTCKWELSISIKLNFFKRSPKAEAPQIPAQPKKILVCHLRLYDRNRSSGSPVLEALWHIRVTAKTSQIFVSPKTCQAWALNEFLLGKVGFAACRQPDVVQDLFLTLGREVGPFQRFLPAICWVWQGNPSQPCRSQGMKQALRSYFMQVFVGQSSHGSDWECTGAGCSQPSPDEELASSFTTFFFWCVAVLCPTGISTKSQCPLEMAVSVDQVNKKHK